jgi:homoserine kinase type II
MSVYTAVSRDELSAWLKNYSLGNLLELSGIASGIENTNYFVTTTHGRYVLTLFEKIGRKELPFFINLMAHLASHGIPCPSPIASLSNGYLGTLKDRPACLVSCLEGVSILESDVEHCRQVAEILADMHLAGRTYPDHMDNPRGPHWWRETAKQVLPRLSSKQAELLNEELRFQSLYRFQDLPRGVIHADLFRDNVLFRENFLSGVIDFYYACNDTWLFDLAVTVNDWCVLPDGRMDTARLEAMLRAYHETRPLTAIERGAWPVVLRAGALRFWLSRLYDLHFPRPGELTHAKEPAHFERILREHINAQTERLQMWV